MSGDPQKGTFTEGGVFGDPTLLLPPRLSQLKVKRRTCCRRPLGPTVPGQVIARCTMVEEFWPADGSSERSVDPSWWT
ncbi:MAG TPA: hypothetical protein P5103_00940 [Thermovirgaceae bacterium]|nr:hypothetical protein [Thermovirgaceae bacterium]